MVGAIFTVPLPMGVPSSLPPLSTVMVLSSGTVRLDPAGMVRVSPWLMVRLSSRVTLPYTVPSVPSNTMPLLFSPVGVGVGSVSEVLDALIPPFRASTMAFSLTVRLVVALVATYAPTMNCIPSPLALPLVVRLPPLTARESFGESLELAPDCTQTPA